MRESICGSEEERVMVGQAWAHDRKPSRRTLAASLLLLIIFGLTIAVCPASSSSPVKSTQILADARSAGTVTVETLPADMLARSDAVPAQVIDFRGGSAHCRRDGKPLRSLPASDLKLGAPAPAVGPAVDAACPAGEGIPRLSVLDLGTSAPSLAALSISRT